jgi:DnaJ-class molecular chaperone
MDNNTSYLDPYITLGLNKEASEDDVKKAYKKLALKYHPDKNGGDDVMFKKVNEAYQILIDPVKRKLHDMKHETIDYNALTKFATSLFTIIQEKLQEKLVPTTKEAQPSSYTKGKEKIRTRTRAQQQTTEFQSNTESTPALKIMVPVDIEDLYNGSIKKVVVKVKRLRENDGVCTLEYTRVPLYISLLHYEMEYIFKGAGDDTINTDIPRGDIVVTLEIMCDPKTSLRIDDLFSRFDLQLEQQMTLYEFYYGIDRDIVFLNGEILKVKCYPLESFKQRPDTPWFYVHEVKGKGLPYRKEHHQEEEDEVEDRGSLFIHFTLELPCLKSDTLDEAKNFFINYFKNEPIGKRA